VVSRLSGALCLVALVAMGCQGILGLSQGTVVEEPATRADAAAAPDAAGDVMVAPGATYDDVTSTSYWSFFDTTTLSTPVQSFFGGTFDGRYVYFGASRGNLVARFDTHGTFGSAGSWSTFGIDAPVTAGGGTAFDGRWVYFITGSYVSQYDTHSAFDDAGAWATFNVAVISSEEGGVTWSTPSMPIFAGSTFDGRFLYLAPSQGSVVVRFDTTQYFTNPLSWTAFDATPLGAMFDASTSAYQGSVFDGSYVYFVPSGTLPVLRYNVAIDFEDRAAWSAFSPASVESGAGSFECGAYDGRYLYLVPAGTSLALQYDTTLSFSSQHSWSIFDTTTVSAAAAGFGGSAFDGRFVYYVPAATTLVARYDTRSPFTAMSSWGAFDTKAVNGPSTSFAGAVFDGRYLYLAPTTGGGVLRFDARSSQSMPGLPDFSGSFL
jgi:hypothetical protein